MSADLYETMVIIQNSEDYFSWPRGEKLRFYEKAVEWHDYISGLMNTGEVTKARGTQKLPGKIGPNPTKTMLIAIYKTTYDRFSEASSQGSTLGLLLI